MAYDNLSDFINELHDDGELIRISVEVDPLFEIAEITDRISKSPHGGPALFFENVKGSSMPVAVNLLGSYKRMCRALGVTAFEEVAERIEGLINPPVPDGWIETLKQVPQRAQFARLPPRIVRTAACQQVLKLGRDVDLGELPVLQSWPFDAGRLITAGQVFTKNAGSDERSVGTCRAQVIDKNICVLDWHRHQSAYRSFLEYKALGTQMPVAISLGGDPVFSCMATAPLPPNTDECLLGGLLRGAPIDLVKCRTIELEVPASAEIVIEGFVDPTEPWQTCGVFGDRTGFYSLAAEFPLFHVAAITQRANPIYPTTIAGKPPTEEFWLQKANERIFLPLVRMFIPELVDYNLPRLREPFTICALRASERRTPCRLAK